MRRCAICKKNWFNLTRSICDECYQQAQIEVNAANEEIKRYEELLDKDYTRIEQYLSKFKKLLNLYKTIYYYADLLPGEIKVEPKTYKEFLRLIKEDISSLINHRIDVYYFQIERMGDMACIVDLQILENEMLKAQNKYPEFDEELSTTRIQNILSKYG